MTIPELKSQLSIQQVLRHFGKELDKNNRILCPFHEDKIPSLQIYPKSNSYCCFSTKCNAGTGDQLQLLELLLGKDKRAALILAHELLGAPLEKIESKKNLEDIFHGLKSSLKKSKRAANYAKSRHLNIEKLEIGYNGGSYEKLKYCLVFGLKDEHGRVIDFYGRSIYANNKVRHFYQTGKIKGLYPNYPKATTKKLILTESVIDAASLVQHEKIKSEYGILAMYGGNGLKEQHENCLKNLEELEEVIFFLDGDEAGDKAIERYQYRLSELLGNIKLSKVEMLKGEDINSLLDNHDASIYEHLLSERVELLISKPKPKAVKGKLDLSNPNYIVYTKAPMRYTLLGGINLKELDKLRVTIKLNKVPEQSSYYSLRHSLDLYNDDQVSKLIRKASDRLEVGTRELEYGLSELTDEVEKWRSEQGLESKKEQSKRILTKEQIQKAIAYLSEKKLLRRTNEDIGKSGIVGEFKNRLIVYLCFTSRLRATPLHVITLGPSGSGKTYVIEKVSELMPEEEVIQFTSSTENALYYFKNGDLRHKILICEDLDGAEGVLYVLRELLSKAEISKLVPMKDSKGNQETIRVEVKGPVCLGTTTTRDRLYEDNANRALLISPESGEAQSDRIQNYQRRISSGKINKQSEKNWKEFFKDIQSVLQPVVVRNPYAEDLRIPEECFKPLRTNAHYLHFIESITFYHQYQRERKVCPITKEEYIETSLEDIEAGNALMEEVLIRKADELSIECRGFIERLRKWLGVENRSSFYAREVREKLRMNPNTLKYYLSQLKKYGDIKVIGGNRYSSGLEYELCEKGGYEELRSSIRSVLGGIVEKLKEK